MFDPITVDLISTAPPLDALDLEELPRRFTNAYAEIVAARVRMRGLVGETPQTEKLVELIEQMRRLAAAQEAFVAIDPQREVRAAAAFVSGTAHQLCLMAEIVGADLESDETDEDPDGDDEPETGDGSDDDEAVETDDDQADGQLGDLQRWTYIDAVRAAPEVCATLLFLAADAQPDAAEMAKRIRVPEENSGEAKLVGAIADLAAGRLAAILDTAPKVFDAPEDASLTWKATDALMRRLYQGVCQLAGELLTRPTDPDQPSQAQQTFEQVKALSLATLDGVFDAGGPVAVSVYPGPLHVANLLLAVSGDFIESGLCKVPAPGGIKANDWWKIIRRTASRRPYLWRNHREAIAEGYLEAGVSAAVSFPTGGGKSTLAELKIAAALLSNKKVVVLAPTLALVDQTAFALKKTFTDYGVLGDLEDEVTFADLIVLPEIIVTTPERCLMIQAVQPDAFDDVGLVVFDECHLMHPRDADRSRRGVDAMLCVLKLNRAAPDADLLLISAMMQNAEELAGWLSELTGRKALALDLAWKPTRQARGCVVYSGKRITALENALADGKRVATTKGVPTALKAKMAAKPSAFFCLRQTWATKRRVDYALMPLLDEVVPFNTSVSPRGTWYLTPNGNRVAAEIAAAAAEDKLKTLVFVQSTVAAEGAVKTFRDLLPGRVTPMTDDEKAMRRRVEEEMGGPDHCYLVLDKSGAVKGGATSHHAQLLKDERDLHKSLFERRDGLDVLFATSTIAQGMNLPSDIVLIAGDSRWDPSADKMQQLEAHELLNAAGRAGRAGESGQGFVLVIPSKIVDLNYSGTQIDKHWMTLQGIFAQSDQCLEIDDPLTALLDRIHSETEVGGAEEYLVARLPVGPSEDIDGPARAMLSRSFVAYKKRAEGKTNWIESRISAALALRAKQTPKAELTWLAQVAASCGLPVEILESLLKRMDAGRFDGTTSDCVTQLFKWLKKHPEFVLQLLRPTDVEGLFGGDYKKLDDDVERAEVALPALQALLKEWMAGNPLRAIEAASGTPVARLKTCETARHFVNRVVPDLAFVAGLPARILAKKAALTPDEGNVPIVIATLTACVRSGCDSPEVLASSIHQGREVSRVAARQAFEAVRARVPSGVTTESFEDTLDRVRLAHAAPA